MVSESYVAASENCYAGKEETTGEKALFEGVMDLQRNSGSSLLDSCSPCDGCSRSDGGCSS
jgi:hypothetical protein